MSGTVHSVADRRWRRTFWLVGSLLVAAGLVLPVASTVGGRWGVISAAFAWVTCLLSGLLAFWLLQLFNGPDQVVPQVLIGMVPRMGIPLGVCMAVYLRGGPLVEAGFVFYILVFYFVTLSVETILLVGTQQQRSEATTPRDSYRLDHGDAK